MDRPTDSDRYNRLTYGAVTPNNYRAWAILAAVCLLPAGIVAVIQSFRVDALWAQRRYQDAQEASINVKIWCLFTATWVLILMACALGYLLAGHWR